MATISRIVDIDSALQQAVLLSRAGILGKVDAMLTLSEAECVDTKIVHAKANGTISLLRLLLLPLS